ncbi:MAG TPA: tetratricopeptide repeat protein [Bryobacteraceae bacterium]|jgi:tetratricopeptide (TPR) repeat protein|nr:tetratricopeptide repeat protein [Bryobacteraceae bacterium]
MICTILLTLGLAWQTRTPEVVQHVQAGMAAQKQGRLAEAIVEFRKVTELDPKLPAAFVNLGAVYMQDHQYSQAIAPLKRALALKADLIGAQQMLGYALLSSGYAAESIPYLEKVHAQDALGIAQVRVGRFPEAVANLTAALKSRPNDPELLYYLGRASGLLSKEAFDTLESSFPDSARAHQALAENYAVLRQVPTAEKEYLAALRLRPDTPGIHLALGDLYVAASEWPKAEEQFRAEAKLQPGDAEPAYRLGNALLQQGKIQDAKSELERADRLRPGMPETLYALGKAQSLSGDMTGAEKSWRQVIALEKKSSLAEQAHFGLAGLYRKQGKTEEAEREMQAYRQLQK